MNTGEFIRNRRQELGLSQIDVAIACGVTRSTVCRWENGEIKNAKRAKIVALANVLNLDPMSITMVEIGRDELQKEPANDERQALIDEAMLRFSQLPEDVKAQALAYADFLLSSRADK